MNKNKKLPPKNTTSGISSASRNFAAVFSLISLAIPFSLNASNTSSAKLTLTGHIVERLTISEASNKAILTRDGVVQISSNTSYIDRGTCFKSSQCSKFYIQGPDSYHYSMISSEFSMDESSTDLSTSCKSLTNQSETHGILNAQGKDLVSCATTITEKNGQETVILIYD